MRIGAYSLCYQEGELLAANISLMYERVDKFVIVIGQVEVSESHKSRADTSSRTHLLKINDPLRKITIIEENFFETKDEMAHLAQKALNVEILLQLDSDEFWSIETFDHAITELRKGSNRILIPHTIYFRGPKQILSSRDFGDHYFAPPRMWVLESGAKVGHFSGSQTIDEIHVNNLDSLLPKSMAIHHLGWVQRNQILRKVNFYRRARNYKMPSAWLLILFWRIKQQQKKFFILGPNVVKIKSNPTEGIPKAILEIATRFAQNRKLV